MGIDLASLARSLRESRSFAAKADIADVVKALGIDQSAIVVGDDCAAIPDGDGYLLFAIEGFINEFVASDPWFAGWCGVMVNVSDIAAMGGRPLATVNALWSDGHDGAVPMLEGLRDASRAFEVPMVGGHSNLRTQNSQLALAILGRAKKLLTSFDAAPGDHLVAVIDLRGRYRDPYPNWDAATSAPPMRLRGDLELLPEIAEAGLARAGKDISQGGIIGTATMLAECSGVGAIIDIDAIPIPPDIAIERWLQTFPSFGYLLAVGTAELDDVLARFHARDIAAAAIGTITGDQRVRIESEGRRETVWDLSDRPLIGCAPAMAAIHGEVHA
ncbi:sll0787 family AIR synthase-like protein [Sphingobium sp. LB126]|uniref:sll0787 family AIR synthase-like protein n=1 Tax=Sphingobium sp. LB126 TaxID=1983755 RepID=UPI001F5B56DA|nr:sll0787 family AIR synthase-like protein [Sphingobium sp. LB126]